jgi:site-specific recombinase XerD
MTADLIPAHTADDNARLAAATDEFLRFVTSRSEHTGRAYRRDLDLWFRWLAARGLHPLGVNRGAALAWQADLPGRPATVARRLAAVSSWYQYLVGLELTDRNPAALSRHQRPHVDRARSHTLALSTRQVDRLLALADADGPRTSALVWLLATSGARVDEALSADIEDLTQQSGQPVLPISGKGRRKRTIPLAPAVYDRIGAYLATRADVDLLPAVTAGARPRRPLFATSTGRRLDRGRVYLTLRRLARQAGGDLATVAGRVTPHVLRHSYATDLLAAGVPLRDVQYAMGHADPSTTERYDHGDLALDRHPTYARAAQLGAVTRPNPNPTPPPHR